MKAIYLSLKNIRRLSFLALGLVLAFGCFLAYQYTPLASVFKENPVYHGTSQKPYASLAINVDWGEDQIPAMLDILAKHQVKASFFLTGRWTDKFPQTAKKIAAAGHEIGNHAYSHASPNALSQAENRAEIKKTAESIYLATGAQTRLYAPPSGECQDHVVLAALEEGHITILWSVDTIDWQKPAPATILQRVNSKIQPGGIILMHPTANTVKALDQMLTDLAAKGFEVVPVSTNISAE